MRQPQADAAATAPTQIYVHADLALKDLRSPHGPRPTPARTRPGPRPTARLPGSLCYAEPLIVPSTLSRENAGRRTPARHNLRLGIVNYPKLRIIHRRRQERRRALRPRARP